jgi:hypothetical protein
MTEMIPFLLLTAILFTVFAVMTRNDMNGKDK